MSYSAFQGTPSAELIKATETLFLAMANVKVLTPIIEACYQKELDENEYFYDTQYEWNADKGRITKLADNWEMPLDIFEHQYYPRVTARWEALGYKVPKEHCPLLVAKDLQTKAEQEVIRLSAQYQDIINVDDIVDVDTRKTYLNITLRFMSRHVKNPLA